MIERHDAPDDAPDTMRLTAAELEQLVKRLRIRHMETIEDKIGRSVDEIDSVRPALKSHALAYMILAARDPEATWEDAGEVELQQLGIGVNGSGGDPAGDPTPLGERNGTVTSG